MWRNFVVISIKNIYYLFSYKDTRLKVISTNKRILRNVNQINLVNIQCGHFGAYGFGISPPGSAQPPLTFFFQMEEYAK
jgi:hypothetical protein